MFDASSLEQKWKLAQIDGHSVPAKFQFLWKAAVYKNQQPKKLKGEYLC
jgi:hypothetical protein